MNQEELDRVVANLRAKGTDGAACEAKSSARGLPRGIWDTVSAFANTSGGTIILGLAESAGFSPAPGFDLQRTADQMLTGLGDGDPNGARVDPCPAYDLVDELAVEGAPVLVITIHELDLGLKPCYVRSKGVAGGSFKRVGDHDVRLSPREIYALQHVLKPSRADLAGVEGADAADLSQDLVDALLRREAGSRMLLGAKSTEERLMRANVLAKDGAVTLAGLLSCGVYPQQFFPRLMVDVAAHAGLQKSDPAQPVRFLDRAVCEGPVDEMVETAYQAVTRNLRTSSYVEGLGRRDQLEIPGDVIREALANALVHREYDEPFLGQSVQVDVYPDRVEVMSPGGLWGGKTLENLGDGFSECRNRALMKLMSRMPAIESGAVLVEGSGSGVPFMVRLMEAAGLEPPVFEAGIDSFKVVLRRPAVGFVPQARRVGAEAGDARGRSDERTAGGAEREYWGVDEWRSRIAEALQDGPRSVSQVADAIGRKRGITAEWMRRLLGEGAVVRATPSGTRNLTYRLSDSAS